MTDQRQQVTKVLEVRNTMMTKKFKTTTIAAALVLAAILGFGFVGGQASASDRDDIEAVIEQYASALGASDVEAVVALYTSDGVFMSPNNQPAIGSEQIRVAYTAAFSFIKIDTPTFGIKEIVSITGDWAYVRSVTFGTATILSSEAEVSGTNAELFILHNDNGWKIAQYIFATTDPRRR